MVKARALQDILVDGESCGARRGRRRRRRRLQCQLTALGNFILGGMCLSLFAFYGSCFSPASPVVSASRSFAASFSFSCGFIQA